MKRKHDEEDDSEVEDPGMQEGQEAAVESDDEVEYYRQAVGQDPDEGEQESKCALRSCCSCIVNTQPFFVQTCFPVQRGGKAHHLVKQ